MNCERCETANKSTSNYCKRCGLPLVEVTCQRCSVVNKKGSNYCGRCGLPLDNLISSLVSSGVNNPQYKNLMMGSVELTDDVEDDVELMSGDELMSDAEVMELLTL